MVIVALEAPVGSKIEILDQSGGNFHPTGRFYKIVPHCPIIGSVTAEDCKSRVKVQVAPGSFCRVVDEEIGAAAAK